MRALHQRGRCHPVMADVGCRNTVFGAEAQEASRHLEAWRRAVIRHFCLEFVHESAGLSVRFSAPSPAPPRPRNSPPS
jgi:hypothetical protein